MNHSETVNLSNLFGATDRRTSRRRSRARIQAESSGFLELGSCPNTPVNPVRCPLIAKLGQVCKASQSAA